jgi:hypothetical protein
MDGLRFLTLAAWRQGYIVSVYSNVECVEKPLYIGGLVYRCERTNITSNEISGFGGLNFVFLVILNELALS